MSASERFELLVEDPQWIEIPSKSQANVFEKHIVEHINSKQYKAVVVILPRFNMYAQVKRCLDKKGVIS